MIPILEKFFKPVKYELIAAKDIDLEREKMYELYERSSEEIWIVAGELTPLFYNEEFANIIKRNLEKYPNFRVNILFSKNENDPFETRKKNMIESDNIYLCKLLEGDEFGGRFSMYMSKKRFPNHFGIADNSILIEEIHPEGDIRPALLVHNYMTFVNKYKRYFQIFRSDSDNKSTKLTYKDFF